MLAEELVDRLSPASAPASATTRAAASYFTVMLEAHGAEAMTAVATFANNN